MKQEKKEKNGFTLIELMVSISIIGLLSGIFLANYRQADRQSSLAFAVQRLAGDIRLASERSLAGEKFQGADPAGGWGISLHSSNPNSYFFFADLNSNHIYDEGEKEAEIFLPPGIVINSSEGGSFNEGPLDISFLPPEPVVFINLMNEYKIDDGSFGFYLDGPVATVVSGRVVLKDEKSGATKAVAINFLGAVEIE